MSTGRFIGGLLIGGALGAIIGMLLAPRKGDETRDIIRDEFSNRINHSVDDVKGMGADLKSKAMNKAEMLKDRANEIAQELEDTGRNTWDKVRSTVKVGKGHEESTN